MTIKAELERQRVINAAWNVAIEHAAKACEEHSKAYPDNRIRSNTAAELAITIRAMKREAT